MMICKHLESDVLKKIWSSKVHQFYNKWLLVLLSEDGVQILWIDHDNGDTSILNSYWSEIIKLSKIKGQIKTCSL